MTRLAGAIEAIQSAVATAADIPFASIGPEEDFVDLLGLDNLELISLQLIIEEIFSIRVPDEIFETPRHRCAASLAEWAIRQSDQAAWQEGRQCSRRA